MQVSGVVDYAFAWVWYVPHRNVHAQYLNRCTICDVSSVYRKPVLGRTSLKVCVPFCFRCNGWRICMYMAYTDRYRPSWPHSITRIYAMSKVNYERRSNNFRWGVSQLLMELRNRKYHNLETHCRSVLHIVTAQLHASIILSKGGLKKRTETGILWSVHTHFVYSALQIEHWWLYLECWR